MATKLEILRMFEQYEDDIDFSDFSPEELEELLARFESDGNRPVTAEEFKKRYFEFYDDVKDKTLKRQDW